MNAETFENRATRTEIETVWAVQRLCSPHPGPLPEGKGESGAARKLALLRVNFKARHPTIPSPWGEGQGEGEGRRRFHLRHSTLAGLFAIISFVLISLAPTLPAATNNLTNALQQGLFEEEANHNLDAAIKEYQSLVTQFDKDRQLAATAVFRLGECYRKLGKTNDAVMQYERVLREFSDQQTLATLSQQNLVSLGASLPATPGTSIGAAPTLSPAARAEQRRLLEEEIKLVENKLAAQRNRLSAGAAAPEDLIPTQRDLLELKRKLVALSEENFRPTTVDLNGSGAATDDARQAIQSAEAQAASLKAQIASLEALKPEALRVAIQQDFPNPVLTALMQRLADAQQRLAAASDQLGSSNPDLLSIKDEVTAITEQIDAQVNGAMNGLHAKLAAALETARTLRSRLANAPRSGTAEMAASTDEEQQEIRRIQALIKNSPDLINAAAHGGDTPLTEAARKGQLVVARFLLDHGAEVSKPNASGGTPLLVAAMNAQNAMVELLLSRGANVDARNNTGWTPLYVVAARGYETVAETLIDHKADVNARANDGRTPLHCAADSGHLALVNLLLAHGAAVNAADNDGRTPLMAATMNNRKNAVVKALLAARADPNLQDKNGRTALSFATQRGEVESVKALLEAQADPNVGQRDLPLAVAVESEGTNITDLLLRAGADPNREATFDDHDLHFFRRALQGSYKCTPLQVLVGTSPNRADLLRLFFKFKADPRAKVPFSDQPLVWELFSKSEMLEAFLQAGADPNVEDGQGNSILCMAASAGNAASVKALLAAGARVNPPADAREIPLFAAVDHKGDLETIRLLLDAGAEVNRRNRNGLTPLLMAVTDRKTAVAALLLAHGADPNLATLDEGKTPLHWAVAMENRPMVELLLTNKADVNLRDKNGQTPLDLARANLAHPGMLGRGRSAFPFTRSAALPGSARFRRPSVNQEAPPESSASLADLLRQHGALDNLPRLDRIEVIRPSANYRHGVFMKDTDGRNHFTLLEVIAAEYGFISDQRHGEFPVKTEPISKFWSGRGLPFPDFEHVVVHQPAPDGKSWTSIPVNVADILSSGDCSRDVSLHWGDVVEIPEADHPVAETWPGLLGQDGTALMACIARTVTVSINGTDTPIKLAAKLFIRPNLLPPLRDPEAQDVPSGGMRLICPSFMLRSVLDQSKLIRFSSDLAHVKVTRRDPKTDQTDEWVLDCSNPKNAPDLWLHDGDVIEVPEKP